MDRMLALVVDADTATRAFVQEVLARVEFETLGATTWSEAVDMLLGRRIRLLLMAPDVPGVALEESVAEALRLRPHLSVILLGVSPEEPGSLSLIRGGVNEILPKPFTDSALLHAGERAAIRCRLQEEVDQVRDELRSREGYRRVVGRSETMTLLREALDRLAPVDETVVFAGEPGTGRELAARTLHSMSPRADGPFIVANCSVSPERLLDAEFFGTLEAGEAGANGLFAQAEGGVLFIDGLEQLPEMLQERLLDFLARGGAGAGGVVRIMAASGTDPALAAEEGRFRGDLLRDLAPTVIRIPPLRERVEDIPVLARYFIDTICRINHLPPIQITAESLSVLETYHWPGNVRELRNAMEQAAILAIESRIQPADLPARVRESSPPVAAVRGGDEPETFRDAKRDVVGRFEIGYLKDLMIRNRGNVTAAAQQAGMLRSALQRLLRKHSLRSSEFRQRPAEREPTAT